MEIERNWNQQEFTFVFLLIVELKEFPVEGDGYIANLKKKIEEIFTSGEKWRDGPVELKDRKMGLYDPELYGRKATFLVSCPNNMIRPTQLRAFCTFTDKFAEKVASLDGVLNANAEVRLHLPGTRYGELW